MLGSTNTRLSMGGSYQYAARNTPNLGVYEREDDLTERLVDRQVVHEGTYMIFTKRHRARRGRSKTHARHGFAPRCGATIVAVTRRPAGASGTPVPTCGWRGTAGAAGREIGSPARRVDGGPAACCEAGADRGDRLPSRDVARAGHVLHGARFRERADDDVPGHGPVARSGVQGPRPRRAAQLEMLPFDEALAPRSAASCATRRRSWASSRSTRSRAPVRCPSWPERLRRPRLSAYGQLRWP